MPSQSFTLDEEHHVITAETEFLELVHTYSSIFDNLILSVEGKYT